MKRSVPLTIYPITVILSQFETDYYHYIYIGTLIPSRKINEIINTVFLISFLLLFFSCNRVVYIAEKYYM